VIGSSVTDNGGLSDSLTAVAQRIAVLLGERGETVSLAETAAGGLISATLVAVPGASAWFLGGAVAYAAVAKERWLGLGTSAFGAVGAVSDTAALRMATATRQATGATWGVAEAGIAGPQTGRRSSKPAGLAYIAVDGPVSAAEEVRTGLNDRAANQRAFAAAALALLLRALESARSAPHPNSSHSAG
jgi:PncC family amidohydrolase